MSRLDHQGCEYAVVDVATNSTTVCATPCVLFGYYINTALSAHALPLQDNTTAVITIPASAAAGSMQNFIGGIHLLTSFVIDPNDAATGNITVWYRKI